MADPNDTYPLVVSSSRQSGTIALLTVFSSVQVGLVFLFNLLLGTGVLTMPAVFAKAGYVVGVFVVAALCFMSYIQVTFLIEAMANANFVKRVLDALDRNILFCV